MTRLSLSDPRSREDEKTPSKSGPHLHLGAKFHLNKNKINQIPTDRQMSVNEMRIVCRQVLQLVVKQESLTNAKGQACFPPTFSLAVLLHIKLAALGIADHPPKKSVNVESLCQK